MAELQEKSHYLPKKTLLHVYSLLKNYVDKLEDIFVVENAAFQHKTHLWNMVVVVWNFIIREMSEHLSVNWIIKRSWVMQQDSDTKHTSCSTKEWLKINKVNSLQWPSQSPDFNPVVHVRKPTNIPELKLLCTEEPDPNHCAGLINS